MPSRSSAALEESFQVLRAAWGAHDEWVTFDRVMREGRRSAALLVGADLCVVHRHESRYYSSGSWALFCGEARPTREPLAVARTVDRYFGIPIGSPDNAGTISPVICGSSYLRLPALVASRAESS